MSEIVREYVATTANNRVVSVDVKNSHAATHLKEQAKHSLWELTQEALRKTKVIEDDIAIQVDMGRPVGHIDLVEADPSEPRIYGRRPNRTAFAPFVERAERPVTNFVVVILRKLARARLRADSPEPRLLNLGLYLLPQHDLFSAYIGIKNPGLPGGDPKYITEESVPFWTRHALVWGSQEVEEIFDGVPPEFRVK